MIFISGHLPDNYFPEAGQKICYANLVDCAKRQAVDLVSFVNEREKLFLSKSDFSWCSSVNFVILTKFTRVVSIILNPFLPIDVSSRCDFRMAKLIKNMVENEPDVRVHIEYEQTAFVLFDLPKSVDSTVVFHDVISQAIERRLNSRSLLSPIYWFWKIQYYLAVRWEKRLAGVVSKSVVLSGKDKELLVALGFCDETISVLPPRVNDLFFSIKRNMVDPNFIIYWGAMNRKENEDAVMWFVSEIFPLVLDCNPDAVFCIVGSSPSEKIVRLARTNIIVTGFVESPVPYFERAAVVVAPLRYGAGVKIKVLEAIAANIPVVGTGVAAEGVDNNRLLHVADDPILFARKVLEITKSSV